MKEILAIDPGASGGLAYWNSDFERVEIQNMPDGMTAIIDTLMDLRSKGISIVVIENVGGYRPGNSGPSACKFARHVGHLEATCYCLGFQATRVAPNTWMKSLGAFSKDKTERKREIKEMMARRYPYLNITLKTSDAVGILTYAMEKK